jgi:hypothetical protein
MPVVGTSTATEDKQRIQEITDRRNPELVRDGLSEPATQEPNLHRAL